MYSDDSAEKSTGASTSRLLRPCRTRSRVRVSRRSMCCTWLSVTALLGLSSKASAREMPSPDCGSPGSNRPPLYCGTGKAWCDEPW